MVVDGVSGGWRGRSGGHGDGQPDRRSGFVKTTSGGDPVSKKPEDSGFEWKSETQDGKTAVFTIDGVPYDLAQGSVFRIDMNADKANADKAIVKQFDLDLGDVQPNDESCIAFISANPELAIPVADLAKE